MQKSPQKYTFLHILRNMFNALKFSSQHLTFWNVFSVENVFNSLRQSDVYMRL